MSLSPDAQMASQTSFSQSHFKQEVVKIATDEQFQSRTETVKNLLKKPLTLNRAICIALLNNSALQAAFAELGVTEAQLVQAVTPLSPTLSFTQISNNASLEIERNIIVNLTSIRDKSYQFFDFSLV
jgi:outer membrane protein TolC